MTYLLLGGVAVLVAWFVIEKARRRSHPVTGGLKSDITLPHDAPFELYGNAFSHCSRKTRLVVAELGIPYTHKPIDLIETGSYETISPHYLRINPAGIVPTLVHHGHPIYESDDIMAYATTQAADGAPSLVPDDPAARAEMDKWILRGTISSDEPMGHLETSAGSCIPGLTLPIFVTAIRYIALHRIAVGLLFHPDKRRPIFFAASKIRRLKVMLQTAPLRDIMHRSRDHMRSHLTDLQAQLAATGGPWILGAQFTLADISWSCIFLRLDETGWLDHFFSGGEFARLSDYYVALRARPSWHDAITEKSHPLIDGASHDLKQAIAQDERIRELLYA